MSIHPRGINRTVLQKYTNKDGAVDYERLLEDEWLDQQLDHIQTQDLQGYSTDQQKAFWLNAYNLLTLKSVRMELEKNRAWEGVTSWFGKFLFFVWRKHQVANRRVSLYTLENKILRRDFDDPRIHFAINCASKSCPYLPGRLFTPDNLDDYLDELTLNFINEQNGVRLEHKTLYLSRIFKWYAKDFGGHDHLIDYIRRYWQGSPISDDIEIMFDDYDWSLNSVN